MADLELNESLKGAIVIAKKAVNDPVWWSRLGQEYLYHACDRWVVINEKIGPKRERIICMVIGSVVVEEE